MNFVISHKPSWSFQLNWLIIDIMFDPCKRWMPPQLDYKALNWLPSIMIVAGKHQTKQNLLPRHNLSLRCSLRASLKGKKLGCKMYSKSIMFHLCSKHTSISYKNFYQYTCSSNILQNSNFYLQHAEDTHKLTSRRQIDFDNFYGFSIFRSPITWLVT